MPRSTKRCLTGYRDGKQEHEGRQTLQRALVWDPPFPTVHFKRLQKEDCEVGLKLHIFPRKHQNENSVCPLVLTQPLVWHRNPVPTAVDVVDCLCSDMGGNTWQVGVVGWDFMWWEDMKVKAQCLMTAHQRDIRTWLRGHPERTEAPDTFRNAKF